MVLRCTFPNEGTMPPEIDKKLCTVCGTCVEECPTDVFLIEEATVVIAHEEGCTECGTCELGCPEEAITIIESTTLDDIG